MRGEGAINNVNRLRSASRVAAGGGKEGGREDGGRRACTVG